MSIYHYYFLMSNLRLNNPNYWFKAWSFSSSYYDDADGEIGFEDNFYFRNSNLFANRRSLVLSIPSFSFSSSTAFSFTTVIGWVLLRIATDLFLGAFYLRGRSDVYILFLEFLLDGRTKSWLEGWSERTGKGSFSYFWSLILHA